jgi:methionine-R-sulfoxide reductase
MGKLFFGLTLFAMAGCNAQNEVNPPKNEADSLEQSKYNKLTPQEEQVIVHKATDRPFTGDYYKKQDKGVYVCRRCNTPLYRSQDKFDSHCGWPSFDQEIKGAVTRVPDADGQRIEIICTHCQGHLGHVFEGEGFTDKDVRHCVNTSSLLFIGEK